MSDSINTYYSSYRKAKSSSYKECDIWMGSENPTTKNTWRKGTNSGIKVDDNVKLYLDTESLSISYSNSYGDGGQYVPNAVGGAMDLIGKVLDSSNALGITNYSAKKISEYDNPKVWESTGPISFDGDLTFRFWFGSSGLFDALEEVVKPAYAIASMFAPRVNSEGGIQTPLPSKAYWMGAFLSSAIKSLKASASEVKNTLFNNVSDKETERYKNDIDRWQKQYDELCDTAPQHWLMFKKTGKKQTGATSGIAAEPGWNDWSSKYELAKTELDKAQQAYDNALAKQEADEKMKENLDSGNLSEAQEKVFGTVAKAQSAYFDAIHAGAKRVIAESGYKQGWAIAYLSIGDNFKFGPFTATGAKLDFDMKDLDSDGWPCRGKVSISGIQYYKTATDKTLIETAKGLNSNYSSKDLTDISSLERNEKGELVRGENNQ